MGEDTIEQDRELRSSYTDLDDTLTGIEHLEKLHQELDNSSREMQSLIDSLNGYLGSSDAASLRCGQEDNTMSEEQDTTMLAAYQEEGGVVRRRSGTTHSASLAERHSVTSTISLSEPDLTVIGVKQHSSPSILPPATTSSTLSLDSGWFSGLSSAESSAAPTPPTNSLPAHSVPREKRTGTLLQLPKIPQPIELETLPSGKPPT